MTTTPVTNAPVAPQAPRARVHPVRRRVERLLLGSIMTVIATLLNRRLRRVFTTRD